MPSRRAGRRRRLAGDIHLGAEAVPWALGRSRRRPWCTCSGIMVLWARPSQAHGTVEQRAEGSRVHVLENDALVLGETVFLGCTLWTDFELFGNPRVAGFHATQRMTDYRKIRVSPEYRRLRSIDTALIHRRSRSWLEGQIDQHRGKKLVVSHSPRPDPAVAHTVDRPGPDECRLRLKLERGRRAIGGLRVGSWPHPYQQ